jgi:GH25 family lysozyme M1 (1,4-beta-N-acetylmuramidase)
MSDYKVCDISRHQGEIDFEVMKAQGIEGVAIRATVGDYYTDPLFYKNWRNAEKAGLHRTAYHVSRPKSGLKSQVTRFKDVVGDRRPDFGNCIGWIGDNECADGEDVARVTDTVWHCLNELSHHAGVSAGNYTRAEWWNRCVKPAISWAEFLLWIARYGDKLKQPWWPSSPSYLIPHSYAVWDLWQREADGNLKGEMYGVIPEPGAPPPSIDLSRITDRVFDGVPAPPVPDPEPIPVPEPTPDLVRVTTRSLRVRSDPVVATSALVGHTENGDIWEVLGEVDCDGLTWVKVPVYIAKKYTERV